MCRWSSQRTYLSSETPLPKKLQCIWFHIQSQLPDTTDSMWSSTKGSVCFTAHITNIDVKWTLWPNSESSYWFCWPPSFELWASFLFPCPWRATFLFFTSWTKMAPVRPPVFQLTRFSWRVGVRDSLTCKSHIEVYIDFEVYLNLKAQFYPHRSIIWILTTHILVVM